MIRRGVNYLCSRAFVSSPMLLKPVIQYVPALGESITEGSIAQWNKSTGDQVAVDDVVCVVETDKVTVDIKSEYSGKFLKRIASELVAVGAPLFEVDSNAESVVSKSPVSPQVENTSITVHPTDKTLGRAPLIKFLGKRSKLPTANVKNPVSPAKVPITQASGVVSSEGIANSSYRGAHFGRPILSPREIEAIISGGATLI